MRGLSAHRHLVLAALFVAASLCAPPRLLAWTNATVRTASTEIELTADGGARVSMRIRVRVDGGWLEALDLDGFDEDAVLDPERPVVFRPVDGAPLPARVSSLERGRVSLSFTRRSAPRRGEYEVELAWTTGLERTIEAGDGSLDARWTLPAWRFGLDGVEVRWIVPIGSAPEPEEELAVPMETLLEPQADGTGRVAVIYRRAHLPRTSAWETSVRVPRGAWPHVLSADAASSREGPREPIAPRALRAPQGEEPLEVTARAPLPDPRSGDALRWLVLALVVVLAGVIKRRDLERRARRARRRTRWLVSISPGVHLASLVVVALAELAAWALDARAAPFIVGSAWVVLVGWQRSSSAPIRPRMEASTELPRALVRQARREAWLGWVAPASWLEPSRLGIASVVIVLAVGLAQDPTTRLLAALFVALVASGSRRRLGPSPDAEVRALARLARAPRAAQEAPRFSLRLFGRGAEAPRDVRLRLVFEEQGARARLLAALRAEIVLVEGPALRIAARVGSDAELALRAWAEHEGLVVHEFDRSRGALAPLDPRAPVEAAHACLRSILSLAPLELDATLADEASSASLCDRLELAEAAE